jgi:hypothetical protein
MKRVVYGFWSATHVSAPNAGYRDVFSSSTKPNPQRRTPPRLPSERLIRTPVYTVVHLLLGESFIPTSAGIPCYHYLAPVWRAFQHGGQTFTCGQTYI